MSIRSRNVKSTAVSNSICNKIKLLLRRPHKLSCHHRTLMQRMMATTTLTLSLTTTRSVLEPLNRPASMLVGLLLVDVNLIFP